MLRSLKVDDSRIDQTMSSTTPQQTVHRFTVVGSTNDEAKTLAVAGALHGTIVRSDSQTAGRGRHGRRWESSVGNLYLSYIFRPETRVRTAAQIGYIAAVSVAEIIEELAVDVVQVTCKWPNDVLVDGKKVCGILAESSVSPGGTLDWIVIGIGINLTSHPHDVRWPATNLQAAFKRFIVA
ncbi:MAG: biotin--[acetyl-CoA-carboxylase] ligase, partial [Rhodospirillaceae bacterium]|nr:biotin--[acetyl-CoA-carboxylase] ligase [Rhodospirillaceae bacterium]